MQFINKFSPDLKLRDSINPKFQETYAKMIQLEGILEEFRHQIKIKENLDEGGDPEYFLDENRNNIFSDRNTSRNKYHFGK